MKMPVNMNLGTDTDTDIMNSGKAGAVPKISRSDCLSYSSNLVTDSCHFIQSPSSSS